MLMYSNKILNDFMTFYFFSFSDFFSVNAMPLTQLNKIIFEVESLFLSYNRYRILIQQYKFLCLDRLSSQCVTWSVRVMKTGSNQNIAGLHMQPSYLLHCCMHTSNSNNLSWKQVVLYSCEQKNMLLFRNSTLRGCYKKTCY
jgi:hypothetical protein